MSPMAEALNGGDQELGGDHVKQKATSKISAPIGGPASEVKTSELRSQLEELFSDNVVMKIWKTATEHLEHKNPPERFPETVPQSGPDSGAYRFRDAEFWTCGFFPGSVHCLLERSIKHPQSFLADKGDGHATDPQARALLRENLVSVCRDWAAPLHAMAHRTDTHDIGFIVEPALRRDYELTSNPQSLKSLILAAENLASRYMDCTQAIRSWDTFVNNRHSFISKETDFLVIIDSMCNLNLLYYAGHHSSNRRLMDIATTHAHTVRRTHLKKEPSPEGSSSLYPLLSTCHVANLCPDTGRTVKTLTAQGYSDSSTWARGQAWAVLGYAQTYTWTKDPVFLSTACGLADCFISRLESSPACVEVERHGRKVGRYVPLWDFDAPVNDQDPLRDSSAGMIAANGMIVLHSALVGSGDWQGAQRFLQYAVAIVKDTIGLCYASNPLSLVVQDGAGGRRVVAKAADDSTESFEALLRCATANFNEDWTEKFSNHGLVYGDYYLLEFGNSLLNAGFC